MCHNLSLFEQPYIKMCEEDAIFYESLDMALENCTGLFDVTDDPWDVDCTPLPVPLPLSPETVKERISALEKMSYSSSEALYIKELWDVILWVRQERDMYSDEYTHLFFTLATRIDRGNQAQFDIPSLIAEWDTMASYYWNYDPYTIASIANAVDKLRRLVKWNEKQRKKALKKGG